MGRPVVGDSPRGCAYQLGVAMSVLQSLREIWSRLLSSLISSSKTEIRWTPGLNYRYKFALLWWQPPHSQFSIREVGDSECPAMSYKIYSPYVPWPQIFAASRGSSNFDQASLRHFKWNLLMVFIRKGGTFNSWFVGWILKPFPKVRLRTPFRGTCYPKTRYNMVIYFVYSLANIT